MKTIGLIGGTSWESTAVYYRLLNEGVRARLGGLHSARMVLVSVDCAPLAEAMGADRWDVVGVALAEAAQQLQAGGVDCIALCTNTMHKVADAIVAATPRPFIDIVDVAGQALVRERCSRPLLLATRYTMEHDFYRAHLRRQFGIEAVVPSKSARDVLHAIIFDELCQGRITPEAKAAVLVMIAAAAAEGCDGVIFGCTEIGLLLTQADMVLPVFDTAALHCEALLEFAFSPAQMTSPAA